MIFFKSGCNSDDRFRGKSLPIGGVTAKTTTRWGLNPPPENLIGAKTSELQSDLANGFHFLKWAVISMVVLSVKRPYWGALPRKRPPDRVWGGPKPYRGEAFGITG